MYFAQFPKLRYGFYGETNQQVVTDIIKRVKIRQRILDEASLYDLYFVRDGETPDMVAANVYDDSNKHWIILMTNVIINPYFDWPMAETVLKKYVIEKYPGTYINDDDQEVPNYYAPHHWELESPNPNRDGIIMPTADEMAEFDDEYVAKLYDPSIETINMITNIEYEEALNDARREIRLLKPSLVPDVENEFKKLVVI